MSNINNYRIENEFKSFYKEVKGNEGDKCHIKNINGFKEITICEDESEAYEYWKHNFNPKPEDCCNLRKL